MKTWMVAVLMAMLCAACDGAIGDTTDGEGLGGGAGGSALPAGVGGQGAAGASGYTPDPAPDCPEDTAAANACVVGKVDRAGNNCMLCTGDIPVTGCAIRANSAHSILGVDMFCVGAGRCDMDCAYLWP